MSYIRYLSMGSLLTPLSLLTYNLCAEMVTIEPTSPWIPPKQQSGLLTPLGNPVATSRLPSSFFNAPINPVEVPYTNPYLPSQVGLITPLGNKEGYSSPARDTPSFYFSGQKIYGLNPATGNWGWYDNAAGINPIMQGP